MDAVRQEECRYVAEEEKVRRSLSAVPQKYFGFIYTIVLPGGKTFKTLNTQEQKNNDILEVLKTPDLFGSNIVCDIVRVSYLLF